MGNEQSACPDRPLEQLLSDIAYDDETGLERLVAQITPKLTRYARLLLRNRCMADEAVADTFGKIWSRRKLYKAPLGGLAYVTAICRNTCLDRLRRYRRQPCTVCLERIGELAAPIDIEAQVSSRVDTERLVQASLSRLSTLDREVLYLRFGMDLTYEDTASLLQIPTGTAKSRVHHAVKRLSEEIAAQKSRVLHGTTGRILKESGSSGTERAPPERSVSSCGYSHSD